MKEQVSFSDRNRGVLYLVPTPIGNLEDMTFRAVRILKEVDFIAAEDTRQTLKLLRHYEIETPLTSYHEHNKKQAGQAIIQQLEAGKRVALVSDAGMPAISDPGEELVSAAIAKGIAVIALPGANAALTSLIASGLPTTPFQFVGFLPRKQKQRDALLERLKEESATLLFYESPHRLKEMLHSLYHVFGNRRIVISRELTKKYEEYQRGTLEEALRWCESGTVKGEFTIVVEGAKDVEKREWWHDLSEKEHVLYYVNEGFSAKEAIKKAAKDRGVPKRDVYRAYHELEK